jgi:hypothetical protein
VRTKYIKRLSRLFANPKFGISAPESTLFLASQNETEWNRYEESINAICADGKRRAECVDIANVRISVLLNKAPHYYND